MPRNNATDGRSPHLASFFAWLLIAMATVTWVGCQPPAAKESGPGADEHEHAHHHEEHGPHGGHMVHLEPSGGHAEWTHDDEAGKLAVYVEEIEELGKKVEGVRVELEVAGAEKKTYSFKAGEKGVFEIESPELITAIAVGSGEEEKLKAELILTVDGKEEKAKMEHHEHDH